MKFQYLEAEGKLITAGDQSLRKTKFLPNTCCCIAAEDENFHPLYNFTEMVSNIT